MILPPSLYDLAQAVLGFQRSFDRLRPHLAGWDGRRILDVGGGTGRYAGLAPPSATYVCMDNDPAKLARLVSTGRGRRVIVGDATRMALRSGSIDCALCIALTHHLSDALLVELFQELARVVRTRLVFLEAVSRPTSLVSRLLWKLDAGSYPRPAEALVDALSSVFSIDHIESYAVYHEYVLCIASPRREARAEIGPGLNVGFGGTDRTP